LILSTVEQRAVFNPYQLSPNLTPAIIPALVNNKDYTSALLVALKLNLNIRTLLRKIPIQHVNSTVGELEAVYA